MRGGKAEAGAVSRAATTLLSMTRQPFWGSLVMTTRAGQTSGQRPSSLAGLGAILELARFLERT